MSSTEEEEQEFIQESNPLAPLVMLFLRLFLVYGMYIGWTESDTFMLLLPILHFISAPLTIIPLGYFVYYTYTHDGHGIFKIISTILFGFLVFAWMMVFLIKMFSPVPDNQP